MKKNILETLRVLLLSVKESSENEYIAPTLHRRQTQCERARGEGSVEIQILVQNANEEVCARNLARVEKILTHSPMFNELVQNWATHRANYDAAREKIIVMCVCFELARNYHIASSPQWNPVKIYFSSKADSCIVADVLGIGVLYDVFIVVFVFECCCCCCLCHYPRSFARSLS